MVIEVCLALHPIICWINLIYWYAVNRAMTSLTKAQLLEKIAELENSAKITKKVAKKANKIVQKVEDGFHDYARLNSLTGGKDIKISAITKDGKISGYYLANMFPNYDGKAKGLHIPLTLVDVVFDKLNKCEIKNLA